jgi:hypothetical protein
MGKYLDLLRQADEEKRGYERNEINEKRLPATTARADLFRFSRLFRTLHELERRCPEHVEVADWQQAVVDGRRFLAQWDQQADSLGWTARDLFGLQPVPHDVAPGYRRLSRYDETGLIWLLRGRPVIALTESTAAIQSKKGPVTTFRRHRRPALGPLGDSLDDLA